MQVRLVALVPVLGLLLAGCSGGGSSAAPEPTSTLEPLPSATTSTPTPSVPAEANQATIEGAEAFARYYYETLRLAFLEGDASRLRSLAASGCQACAAMSRVVDAEAAAGTRYSGGEITQFIAEGVQDSPQAFGVLVNYSSQPYVQTPAGGSPKTVQGARSAKFEMQLLRAGEGWQVREIVGVQ